MVITHGTDTLEETAYFLDTMEVPHMPIVPNRAMRSSKMNSAVMVFITIWVLGGWLAMTRAADKGVLVVMNDEIHAASMLQNAYDQRPHLPNSNTTAPLVSLWNREILYFKTAEPSCPLWPWSHTRVWSLSSQLMPVRTDELIDMLDLEQLDGLIIQAFGAGNIPKETAQN